MEKGMGGILKQILFAESQNLHRSASLAYPGNPASEPGRVRLSGAGDLVVLPGRRCLGAAAVVRLHDVGHIIACASRLWTRMKTHNFSCCTAHLTLKLRAAPRTLGRYRRASPPRPSAHEQSTHDSR